MSTSWWLDALKYNEKIIRENAFELKTKETRNKLNPGLSADRPPTHFFFNSKYLLIGFRNYDCDGNGNVKKAIWVTSKTKP